jgi:hypothetical protein
MVMICMLIYTTAIVHFQCWQVVLEVSNMRCISNLQLTIHLTLNDHKYFEPQFSQLHNGNNSKRKLVKIKKYYEGKSAVYIVKYLKRKGL